MHVVSGVSPKANYIISNDGATSRFLNDHRLPRASVVPPGLNCSILDVNMCTCLRLQKHSIPGANAASALLLNGKRLPVATRRPPCLHGDALDIDMITRACKRLEEDDVTILNAIAA